MKLSGEGFAVLVNTKIVEYKNFAQCVTYQPGERPSYTTLPTLPIKITTILPTILPIKMIHDSSLSIAVTEFKRP